MIGKVTFIAGLSGAGKSEYLKKLVRDTGAIPIPDYKKDAINNNPKFNFSQHFNSLITGLSAGRAYAVADIDFCKKESQDEADYYVRKCAPNAKIEWLFFSNDPEQCKRNAKVRAEATPRDLKHEIELIDYYSSQYHIPPASTIIPVWRPPGGAT